MYIHSLYVHPVKSLRPISVQSAKMTAIGPEHDRVFMLQKQDGDAYKFMRIADFPQLSLFHTSFGGEGENVLIVTYSPPKGESRELRITLQPDTCGLVTREIVMYSSACMGYDMGDGFSGFFSDCLGFPTRLVYLGSSRRPVIGNIAPMERPGATTGSARGTQTNQRKKVEISFADCAPVMITNMASLRCVGDMIGEEMDVTKFRPNMVVAGEDGEEVSRWEEDFWGELLVGDDKRISLTGNCPRCTSINVDYSTGGVVPAEKQPLKKLMKDRRVDPGMKYSPVFGRYGIFPGKRH
ncbi:unnamed protein product [Tuber melanosporum]|uniref:(Perigord truffle) hypothetical protein n=1 Tax=Tuber melanosporum (strain Mel28) TaxID=656061 RepID=D5G9N7_TUBMM|nr:uncharacterized protein GSTUM_00004993001 [Tuber melanosporum]CAZ81230.1 unnamed protein product [Tuber melanosporum]